MGCNTTTLEFDVTVDDPSSQVYYAFADLANVSNAGFHTLATASPGPSTYSVVASWWNTADLMGQLAGTNTITWTAGAVAHSGQVILDGPHQLTITPPDCPAFPTLSEPLIPRIPSLLPYIQPALPLNAVQTDTPTATATTCGPDTTYEAASNSCVKVPTNTPIPTKRPPACKKYTDESSCGAASCHWNSKTSTCGEP
jgi:hypothetical protein